MVDFYHPLSHKRPLEVDGDVQVHASKRLRDQQRETIPMDSAPQPQQADHEVPSITYASPDYRPPTQSYFCWIPQPDTFMEEALVDNVGFRGSLESGWSTTSLGHWHEC